MDQYEQTPLQVTHFVAVVSGNAIFTKMTKYITIKLTTDQAYAIIRDLEFEMVDRTDSTAYEQRIVNKIYKALANSQE